VYKEGREEGRDKGLYTRPSQRRLHEFCVDDILHTVANNQVNLINLLAKA
jgi:hypothetical protein